jgi:hypothetical protein
MLSNLAKYQPSTHLVLMKWVAKPDNINVTWGSGCSGTDSPRWVWESLARVLKQVAGIDVSATHLVSAEIHPGKRRFIRLAPTFSPGSHPPLHL